MCFQQQLHEECTSEAPRWSTQLTAELSQMYKGALSSAAQPCTFCLLLWASRVSKLCDSGELNAHLLKGKTNQHTHTQKPATKTVKVLHVSAAEGAVKKWPFAKKVL